MPERKINFKNTNQNKIRAILLTSVFVFFILGFTWIVLKSYVNNQYLRSRNLALEHSGNKRTLLESKFNQMLYIPDALSAYGRANKKIELSFFRELSKELCIQVPIFRNMSLAPNNIVEFVYPLKGNEKVIGFNYLEHPIQSIDVKRAMNTKTTIITGPINLIQGGKAFIVRSPVFIEDTYWGMVSMVADYDNLIKEAGLITQEKEYQYSLRGVTPNGGSNNVFFGDTSLFNKNPVIQKIRLPGGDTWELGCIPQNGWQKKQFLSVTVLLIVLIIIFFVSSVIYSSILNHFKLKSLFHEKDLLANQLKEANDSQNKLFSIIAHDLRTPFNILVSTVELFDIKKENLSPDFVYPRIIELKKHAQSLNFLLDNLLEWGKQQLGETNFKPSNILISDIIEDSLDLMEPIANDKKIKIQADFPKNKLVYCDRYMIDTILRNLLANAVKFSNQGGKINLLVTTDESKVNFQITDEGAGIPEDKIPILFDSDRKKISFGTDGEKGSGLGLILCKQFVQLHNGEINVVSTKDRGSTFSFNLPKKL